MTNPDIEVLALAYAKAFYGENFDPHLNPEAFELACKATISALTALRSTTAEPVAYLYRNDEGSIELILDPNGEYARRLIENGYTEAPLYYAHHPTDSAAKDAEIEKLRQEVGDLKYMVAMEVEAVAALREALESVADVIDCIADQVTDEGDRIYFNSTNDPHTLRRQARRLRALANRGEAGALAKEREE